MSFSVHNAYLHMTNVNTTEDKRITPPPVIMILALHCLWGEEMCIHVCVFACVFFACVCADRRVYVCMHVCVYLRERTKTPSGPNH